MSVDVGRNQLRASFAAHRDASHALEEGASTALLLFYSVECGLKAILLDRRNWRSTSDLPKHLKSHNLHDLAKELLLPSPLCELMVDCTGRKGPGERVAFGDLHQAWRYGRALEKKGEERAIAVLRELLGWCQRELRV
ncbi:hypothetical protein FHR32_001183 [Streptosporangium album]|uniref:HEPN domain-containing protein n=1 Tax=Streptosporangium album TaxID=47479 RepID=A0A7W7RSN8_9ACTN|nr:hypothetical protein [Streptosporangium album]MBB4936878.1 hypothetical protein [Streptosporangium album]